jgi:hypothetical protein
VISRFERGLTSSSVRFCTISKSTIGGLRMTEAVVGEMLLTVFLKHRQSMNLAEINQKLEATGFWQKFPPPGVEVVSWCVMLGIGQVVTLKLPADQLRAVNLALEQNAWGAFQTEFYPTYDFRPVWQGIKERAARSEGSG